MANGNGNGSGGSLGQYYSPITNQLYPMASDNTTNPLMPPTYAGDPEAAGAAQASSMMAPAVKSYLSDVFSGRMFERGMERYFGQPTPDSSQPLSQQANLTMDSPAVNMALSFGPGIIAGPRAATAELTGGGITALENAQRMETGAYPYNRPLNRDTIFGNTGWYRGVDDQWRFIIPDYNARLDQNAFDELTYQTPAGGHRVAYMVPPQGMRLGDLLEHDDLYQAYPWMADINVKPTPLDQMHEINGSYNHSTNTMLISPREASDFGQVKSTILHEAQHAVQSVEGFARGGSPDEFLPPTFNQDFLDLSRERGNIRDEIKGAGFDPNEVEEEHGFFGYGPNPYKSGYSAGLDPDILSRYESAANRWQDFRNLQLAAHRNYHNLAGEVESRVTQAMDLLGRWDQPPWRTGEISYRYSGGPAVTQYTPEAQQVVKFDRPGMPVKPQPGPIPGVPDLPEGYGYEPMPEGFDPFGERPGGGQ